jgi:hypothetical protein
MARTARGLQASVARNDTKGDDPFWFDLEEDVARAEQIIRSRLSQRELRLINASFRSALPKSYKPLTYTSIAVSYLTFAKDVHTSDGDVPSTAVQGMLRHLGISSNGAHVRQLIAILKKLNLVKCVEMRYWTGQSRRYALSKIAYSLPFLAEHKPTENNEPLQSQRLRYVQFSAKSGGGQVPLLFDFSTTSPHQYEVLKPTMIMAEASRQIPCWMNPEPDLSDFAEFW